MTRTNSLTLDRLSDGQVAIVTALTSTGSDRRRMMDLGVLPGARIEIAMTNPLGDPTAYNIRGAVIALRNEQARMIQISLCSEQEQTE
jgi:Fe2+ transport system protein FeoA